MRGFRIELGEIEQNIETHEAIQQNVVVVREDTSGDTRLVAYYVAASDREVRANQLREHLRESVPYYMVPQHFVQLDSMPQTNNGKIDYKALPAPSVEAGTADEDQPTAETPAEKFMCQLWSDVLDTDDVGLNDTFFDVGGHSLLVMQVITEVNDQTGIKLGPQDFLVCTLQQLAGKLDESYAFKGEPSADLSPTKVAVETEVAESAMPVAQEVKTSVESESNSQSESNTDGNGRGWVQRLKGFWD